MIEGVREGLFKEAVFKRNQSYHEEGAGGPPIRSRQQDQEGCAVDSPEHLLKICFSPDKENLRLTRVLVFINLDINV